MGVPMRMSRKRDSPPIARKFLVNRTGGDVTLLSSGNDRAFQRLCAHRIKSDDPTIIRMIAAPNMISRVRLSLSLTMLSVLFDAGGLVPAGQELAARLSWLVFKFAKVAVELIEHGRQRGASQIPARLSPQNTTPFKPPTRRPVPHSVAAGDASRTGPS